MKNEIIAEMPQDRAPRAAYRMSDIMVREGSLYVPDVGLYAAPALMHYLSKEAEAKFDESGTLIPWDVRDAA